MARPSEDAWNRVLDDLRSRLGDRRFDLWLSDIRPADGSTQAESEERNPATGEPRFHQADLPGHYTLAVPTVFVKQWIQDRFSEHIEAAFREVMGEHCTVSLVVDPTLSRKETASGAPPTEGTARREDPPAGARRATTRRLADAEKAAAASLREPVECEGTPLNERLTMDRFVPGRCNMIAYRCAAEVIESPGKLYNPLYIYSQCGLGKTHLLQAIAWELKRAGRRVIHTSCEEFINRFVYAASTRDTKSLRDFRSRSRTMDVLLLDDVHLLRNKSATQDEFLHFFDSLATYDRQIVLSADCHPREIKRLKRELVTRFMSGMVARLDAPDEEVRRAILRRKAAEMAVEFSESVLALLAGAPVTSIRELEGLLVRIGAYASLRGEAPDLAMAREALQEITGSVTQPINLRAIEAGVVEYFNITPEELRSHKRRKSVTFPRQIAMYLARSLTACSLQEIGNFFGGKNHATVLFAERKITAARQEDAMVDEVCEAIRSKFQRREATARR